HFTNLRSAAPWPRQYSPRCAAKHPLLLDLLATDQPRLVPVTGCQDPEVATRRAEPVTGAISVKAPDRQTSGPSRRRSSAGPLRPVRPAQASRPVPAGLLAEGVHVVELSVAAFLTGGYVGTASSPVSRLAARSAMARTGALVCPEGTDGMTEASAIRNCPIPRTFSCGSATAMASVPILQVPTGWKNVVMVLRR